MIYTLQWTNLFMCLPLPKEVFWKENSSKSMEFMYQIPCKKFTASFGTNTGIIMVNSTFLQTIYVLNKEILLFFGLKSKVYNQEQVIMTRVRSMESVCQGCIKS